MAFNYLKKDALDYDNVKQANEKLKSVGDYNPYSSEETRKAMTERDSLIANKPQDWNTDVMSQDKLEAYNNYKNREKFSYDMNADALYNQYKDQYVNQGKLAMQDTMGQAAALTGGYGNSYSAAVGNEAYQSYLGKLNDVVPELYQLALNQYNQEGDRLSNVYNMASNEYNSKYGEYRDTVSDWQNNLNRADNNVYNSENLALNTWSARTDSASNAYNTALNWATNDSNTDYSNQFANYQQNVSEDQWNKDYALNQAQLAASDQSAKIKDLENQLAVAKGNDYTDWGKSDWNEYLNGIKDNYGVTEAMSEATKLVESQDMPRDVFYELISNLFKNATSKSNKK